MNENKIIPKRSSKKDRIDALQASLKRWVSEGCTPQQAIDKLTPAQFDFLIDNDVNLDSYSLTPEQIKNVKEITRSARRLSPDGYNKKYPLEKQVLYNDIVKMLVSQGALVQERAKPNYRDLDFTLNNVKYKIVLSNPRG